MFKDEYFTPYKIATIPHEPWAERAIPIPKAKEEEIIELLRYKIAVETYEPGQSSYRSRWFCIEQKDGKLRIVHDLQKLNSITIRDSGLPSYPDEFIESMAEASIYTVFNLFWGYDNRKLAKES